jgi:hypothetical protein
MISPLQEDFLRAACDSAGAAGHIFPEYAACEAALESNWGQSALARRAFNLFGQKASGAAPPESVLLLPTQEFLEGRWVTVMARWARFPDFAACFGARMALLRRLQSRYPAYRRALAAVNGEVFVTEVSRGWSTDPQRAAKVLALHRLHGACLVPARDGLTRASAGPAHVSEKQGMGPGGSQGLEGDVQGVGEAVNQVPDVFAVGHADDRAALGAVDRQHAEVAVAG